MPVSSSADALTRVRSETDFVFSWAPVLAKNLVFPAFDVQRFYGLRNVSVSKREDILEPCSHLLLIQTRPLVSEHD